MQTLTALYGLAFIFGGLVVITFLTIRDEWIVRHRHAEMLRRMRAVETSRRVLKPYIPTPRGDLRAERSRIARNSLLCRVIRRSLRLAARND